MSKKFWVLFLSLFLFSFELLIAQVDTAWVRRYNGPGNDWDWATALAVDGSGNVYVTGRSRGSGTRYDYATIKYSPSGDTVWVRRYNGPGNFGDEARALAVDVSGNVYVTGNSGTIKYLPNGDTAWVRNYGGFALVADVSGNVYVTGSSGTIKYLPNGDTAWVRNYLVSGNALTLDNSGNVYETGSNGDYATIKYAPSGDTLWVRRYNGPGDSLDFAFALAVDGSGNVYVTGSSYGSGTGHDYATIKYSPTGDTLWVRRYDGPGNGDDVAFALAVDGSGNVYVTGYSYGSGTFQDYATIKYSPSGDTVWVRRYDGPGNSLDFAIALAVDGSGNLYVTGQSEGSGTSYDYATIKYSPSGDTVWVRRYNGPGNSDDGAYALLVDGSGNLYVTGSSYGSGTALDYATIKYVQTPVSASSFVFPLKPPYGKGYNHGDVCFDNSGTCSNPDNCQDGYDFLEDALYASCVRHPGEDWNRNNTVCDGDKGDLVYAIADGVVKVAKDFGGNWGKVVVIEHLSSVPNDFILTDDKGPTNERASKVWSFYEHLDTFYVTTGQNVQGGQTIIGTVGNANGVYCAHLHWEIRYKTFDGSDPSSWSQTQWNAWASTWDNKVSDEETALNYWVDPTNFVTANSKKSPLYVHAHSPVDLIVVDPDLDSIRVSFNTIPGATYSTLNDSVFIGLPISGEYSIKVVKDTLDQSGDTTYTLTVQVGNDFIDTQAVDAQVPQVGEVHNYIIATCSAKPGDATTDNNVNLTDIIYLVNYTFKGGSAPSPLCRGDVNASGGNPNLADIIYLVNRIFKGGPVPVKSSVCCL